MKTIRHVPRSQREKIAEETALNPSATKAQLKRAADEADIAVKGGSTASKDEVKEAILTHDEPAKQASEKKKGR